jgi:hypothetical protein
VSSACPRNRPVDTTDHAPNATVNSQESVPDLNMPCLLALLAVAFPRVAIVLLWLFTNFFSSIHGIIIPILGFIFLPLTLIVYAYLLNTHQPMGPIQLVFLFIAVVLDLGLVHRGTVAQRRRA